MSKSMAPAVKGKELTCPRKVASEFSKQGGPKCPCIRERCAFWIENALLQTAPTGDMMTVGACTDVLQGHALRDLVGILQGQRLQGPQQPQIVVPPGLLSRH